MHSLLLVLQARSVGNSAKLKRTSLVEAFNLRAAVELQLNNPAGERARQVQRWRAKAHGVEPEAPS